MSPLTWEEFKKILNKIDKQHKVKLIPTSQAGRYTTEEKGKAIRFIVPVISMSNNDISIIEIFTNNEGRVSIISNPSFSLHQAFFSLVGFPPPKYDILHELLILISVIIAIAPSGVFTKSNGFIIIIF